MYRASARCLHWRCCLFSQAQATGSTGHTERETFGEPPVDDQPMSDAATAASQADLADVDEPHSFFDPDLGDAMAQLPGSQAADLCDEPELPHTPSKTAKDRALQGHLHKKG